MARTAFTLRLDTAERVALESLSKVEGRPMNQLINDAIRSYLSHQGRSEARLEASLKALRAYRKQDPHFQQAIATFVEAEATLEDPIEGETCERLLPEKQVTPAGPVQGRIREILRA